MITAAPSAARCLAIEAPIPLEAPVTTATFPASLLLPARVRPPADSCFDLDIFLASCPAGTWRFVPNGPGIGPGPTGSSRSYTDRYESPVLPSRAWGPGRPR